MGLDAIVYRKKESLLFDATKVLWAVAVKAEEFVVRHIASRWKLDTREL